MIKRTSSVGSLGTVARETGREKKVTFHAPQGDIDLTLSEIRRVAIAKRSSQGETIDNGHRNGNGNGFHVSIAENNGRSGGSGSGGSDSGGGDGRGRFRLSTVGILVASIFVGGAITAGMAAFLITSTRQSTTQDTTKEAPRLPIPEVKRNIENTSSALPVEPPKPNMTKTIIKQPQNAQQNGRGAGVVAQNVPPKNGGVEPGAPIQGNVAPKTFIEFVTIPAWDNTYTFSIPVDWDVKSATLDKGFAASSPRGEIVFRKAHTVMSDRPSYGFFLSGARIALQNGLISREDYILRERLFSPMLPPVNVISDLIPSLYREQVRNMRILGQPQKLPREKLTAFTPNGALVRYQYDRVVNKRLVPYEGIAEVMTGQAAYNAWQFVLNGSEAPKELFQKNFPIYATIHDSCDGNLHAINGRLADLSALGNLYLDIIRRQGGLSNGVQEDVRKTLGQIIIKVH